VILDKNKCCSALPKVTKHAALQITYYHAMLQQRRKPQVGKCSFMSNPCCWFQAERVAVRMVKEDQCTCTDTISLAETALSVHRLAVFIYLFIYLLIYLFYLFIYLFIDLLID
jgi:hypothetical protein